MLKVYKKKLCVPNSSTIMVHVIQSVQRAEFKVQSTCNTSVQRAEFKVQSTCNTSVQRAEFKVQWGVRSVAVHVCMVR